MTPQPQLNPYLVRGRGPLWVRNRRRFPWVILAAGVVIAVAVYVMWIF
jgi:hypothetical protein